MPDALLPELRANVENLLRYSSQSTMPSIYGIVAAAEVKRLRQPQHAPSLVRRLGWAGWLLARRKHSVVVATAARAEECQ